MPLFRRPRFTPARDGTFKVRLDPTERALLAGLPDQMEGILASGQDDGAAVRLFPPAYTDRDDLGAEYRRLMRDELVRRRIEAVQTVRDTAGADSLTAEQLDAWMRVLNDARLVLGTILDISEEDDGRDIDAGADDATQRVLYYVLSGIVADAVDALSGALPRTPGEG